ncbi:hypothetical protein BH09MYX1_BH09MYX1_52460 [soil metagenome]
MSKAPIVIDGSQVNHITPTTLTNLEVASTSSVVGVHSACVDPTGAKPGDTAVVAFETHTVNSEDMNSLWWSSYCGGFAGSSLPTYANATQITRGLVGTPNSNPPWSPPDVVYRGQPQLVALGPRDWVALVVLVSPVTSGGSSPHYGTNVAVLLSTNGGASWTGPQLVSVPGTSGGAAADFDKVRWMAATGSQNDATVAGTALNAKSITVTWHYEPDNATYTRTVGWRSAGGANGGFNLNPVRWFRPPLRSRSRPLPLGGPARISCSLSGRTRPTMRAKTEADAGPVRRRASCSRGKVPCRSTTV